LHIHFVNCRQSVAGSEGLARANRTLRGITGLHVIEHNANVRNGRIDEYRVTIEVTFILENRNPVPLPSS